MPFQHQGSQGFHACHKMLEGEEAGERQPVLLRGVGSEGQAAG